VAPAGLAAKSAPDIAINEMSATPNRFILRSLRSLISHHRFSFDVSIALQERPADNRFQRKPQVSVN
jgi:hypothetical protein